MSTNAGQLLVVRQRLTLPAFDDQVVGSGVLDVDTGLCQENRSYGNDSVGEPPDGASGNQDGGLGPIVPPDPSIASRVQVIPEMPTAAWATVTHGEPYFNTVTKTVHVVFTNSDPGSVEINVCFWMPHSLAGPCECDTYPAAQDLPDLGDIIEGAAGGFRLLAGDTGVGTIANTGLTTVAGDIGVFPADVADVTGFPPGTLTGTIYGADSVGTVPDDAQASLTLLMDDIVSRVNPLLLPNALGGLTLQPGLYDVDAGAVAAGQVLTLDAKGDPNAVFIIRCSASFALGAGSQIALVNGAQAANVFFYVAGSASLGAASVFRGNLAVTTNIAVAGGAGTAVHGRLLASAGSIVISAITIIDGLAV